MRPGLMLALCVCALTLASAAGSTTPLPGIQSPSGNIRCLFVPGHQANLLCSLAQADYAKALKAHCGGGPSVDWHGFELPAAKKGTIVCSGGILYSGKQRPQYVNLPYGKVWRHAMFTCLSRATGITCQNRAGHGLFLSRQFWRAW